MGVVIQRNCKWLGTTFLTYFRGSTVGRSGTTSSSVSVICGLQTDALEMPSADLKKETVVASDLTIWQTRCVSIFGPFQKPGVHMKISEKFQQPEQMVI